MFGQSLFFGHYTTYCDKVLPEVLTAIASYCLKVCVGIHLRDIYYL